MAEIQYRCEVAEKKRARSAWERSQDEKIAALHKAAEEAEKKKQEEMRNLTETLTRKLRNEAALQRETALGEALAVARVHILIINIIININFIMIMITDLDYIQSVSSSKKMAWRPNGQCVALPGVGDSQF